ncbi:MAG: hypothetical protein Q8S84_07270 [bacterium]|nr:hypothetical protein [bacterium]MDP3381254.1 hypothetical protein [bacterium]
MNFFLKSFGFTIFGFIQTTCSVNVDFFSLLFNTNISGDFQDIIAELRV